MRRLVAVVMMTMTGMASTAQAADMPDFPALRGGISEGLSVARVNWQGFYVGGQASYGSAHSKIPAGLNSDMQGTFTAPPGTTYSWVGLPQIQAVKGGYGAFTGYNWQFEDVMVGLEGNYIHGGYRASSRTIGTTPTAVTTSGAIVDLSDFVSARVRAGYTFGCFLPYGFLGAGVGNRTVDRSVGATPAPVGAAWTADSKTKLVYGYSAGLGMDIMLVGGLFARAEYEYQRVTSTDVESNVNSVRAGLGYKF